MVNPPKKSSLILYLHLKIEVEIGKAEFIWPTFDLAAAKVMFILAAKINIITKNA